MKSSFLFSVLLCALSFSHAWAQSSALTPPAAETVEQKSAFDKFYDRLGISYFSVLTSPPLKKWNSANAAISPAYGDTGARCHHNCDTYAVNLWNQVNFSYNFGAKMKFNIIPRFTVMLDNPRDMSKSAGEDRALVNLEDTLIGFSGVVYSSENKKFNWWMRPALRLPTSRFTRNNKNGAFGSVSYQPEWVNTFSYDVNKKLQFGLTHIHRIWVYEDRFTTEGRHRILNIPYLTYAFDDHTKLQIYYEHFWETNKKSNSVRSRTSEFGSLKYRDPVYTDVWQNLMVGVSRDITPKFNAMPFISAFVNDVPFSTRSMWLGVWFSYAIK